MPARCLHTPQPWWLAALVVVVVIAIAACGPATPLGSPSDSGSAGTPGKPAATGSPTPAVGSQAPGSSQATAVVRSTTLAARLSTGLSRAVAVVVGSRIFVYGGFTSTGSTTDLILGFDPAVGQVSPVGQLAVPVHDAAGVALGGATLIFGGGSAVPKSAVQRIDSSVVARVIGNLPAPRADAGAVSVGTSAIVIGGGASGVLDRQVLATEDGVNFRMLATLVAGVRYGAVAETGGLIYLIGGAGTGGDTTEIQRIDPTSGSVDVIGRMPQPISHASAMVIGGRILVVGGRGAGNAQDGIWQVDVGTGTAQLVARLPEPISDFAVAVIGSTGYVIGGETDTQVASIVAIVVQ
jgi:hypothetical protein